MDMKYAFCNSDYKMYYLDYNLNSTYHIRTMLNAYHTVCKAYNSLRS